MELILIPDNDPRLRTKCTVANPHDGELDMKMTLQAMFRLMLDHDGMGLAAPQVGITKQFFIMILADKPYVCINPKIIRTYDETEVRTEGCLSFPGKKVAVSRPKKIRVSYQTERGARVEKTLHGLGARCFQHELDHLNGIVMEDVGTLIEE